jgi:hypothetical protein
MTPGSRFRVIGNDLLSLYNCSNFETRSDLPDPAVPVMNIAYIYKIKG